MAVKRLTSMDVLREHLPGDVPLHELEGLAMALDVYYCEELVRSYERGARAMRRLVLVRIGTLRAQYNEKRKGSRTGTHPWYMVAGKLLALARVENAIRQINEEEDL